MRSVSIIGVLLVLPLLAVAKEAKAPGLKFQGQAYELKFAQQNRGESINEYIPPGETLERWTTMIAVRSYPGRRDYQPMAGNLIKALRQQNPLARAALHTSTDGKRSMVDFATWDLNSHITEFNVFIYQLGPDGNSVLAQQFAQRVYGEKEGLEFMRQLKELRPKLLTAVGEFKFPAIK